MRSTISKSLATCAAVALSLALGACGNKTEEIDHGETEGIYVNVADLKYQVQISRALNPLGIDEDATFVQGVEQAEAELADDEVWFAVFVRVENESGEPQIPARHFEIEDTRGRHFEPVELGETNAFRYLLDPIQPNSVSPEPDSVARQLGSIGGRLLLFKLPYDALDARPLELVIETEEPEDHAVVELDV